MRNGLMKLAASAACAVVLLAAPALAQGMQNNMTNSAPSATTTTPAPSTQAPGTPAAPAPGMAMAPATTPAAAGGKLGRSQEFSSATAAAASCPGDSVVWSTLGKKSRTFHASGSRYYGKTKHGAYVCEKAALAAGYHRAKS